MTTARLPLPLECAHQNLSLSPPTRTPEEVTTEEKQVEDKSGC